MKQFLTLVTLQICSYVCMLTFSLFGTSSTLGLGTRILEIISNQAFWWGLWWQIYVSINSLSTLVFLVWFIVTALLRKDFQRDSIKTGNLLAKVSGNSVTPLAFQAAWVLVTFLLGFEPKALPMFFATFEVFVFMCVSSVALILLNRIGSPKAPKQLAQVLPSTQ